MAASPPIKPPRGIKPTKETSGLLMSVIRALSASETNEQREVEKAKLEKEYKRSDKRLDELVSANHQNLTEVMKIFGELSERVTASRERIHSVKEKLNACKHLLRCRSEDLSKLWLEGLEHKHTLQLLSDIEQLREVPSRVNNYLNGRLYLHATRLLVTSATSSATLRNVEALREVRTEVKELRSKVETLLTEELKKLIFCDKSAEKDWNLKRQGSNREFERGNERASGNRGRSKRLFLDVAPNSNPNKNALTEQELLNLTEDEESPNNASQNPEYLLAIVIECLVLLNKLPEIVENIKKEMQNQFLRIIEETTNSMKRQITESKEPLLDLLRALFDKFRSIAQAHDNAIHYMEVISRKHAMKNLQLYEISDVWREAQIALQRMLTDYLRMAESTSYTRQSQPARTNVVNNINGFFARRRNTRQRTEPLFKFDGYSALASSVGKESNFSEGKLICKADPKNVTTVFRPILLFSDEIERALNQTNSCVLRSFIIDYVKDVYLGMHHESIAMTIDAATKNTEAWRDVVPPELAKQMGLTRPLLHSTVKVYQSLSELRDLMFALPLHGEHFCTLALNILHNYRETCQAAYRGVVQPEAEDKRICSAAWLNDEDISRFIKSLPNWANLKARSFGRRPVPPPNPTAAQRRAVNLRQETQEEESPEDVRQRNLREAEILASNLGEGGIGSDEILSDVVQLKALALLQESMEWFAVSVRSFIDELNSSGEIIRLPKESSLIESLEQCAGAYDELANTCTLVLHLEVRVQCFHYLLPRGEYGNLCEGAEESTEADSRVLELTRVLQKIDEGLQTILEPTKSKYIFEGLGHLISKILITCAQFMQHVDEVSVQTMLRNVFLLQQTLTNVTNVRETALDYARQYYELFYQMPDEILGDVLENGPKFTELEYINALQLIGRSGEDKGEINRHLERLSEILGEVGVTV